MKKRICSILLAMIAVVFLLPTVAFAAGGDYDVDIVASKFSTIQYNGKDTMKIDFMIQTRNDAKVRGIQTALVCVDLGKYDILQYKNGTLTDRTATVSTGAIVSKDYAYTKHYDSDADVEV